MNPPTCCTHDIPLELWAAIFKEVVTSDEDISLSSPMLFLRICHLWRDIALTTPQLWTELYIGADTATQQTDLYLQKSMPLPIEISIDLLDSYRQAPVAVELLPTHLHRIRCLDIRANYLFDAQQVASLIGQNQVAPALQILSVPIIREPSIIMPGTEAGFVTFKSPFSAVPVLDTLTLHLCHLPRETDTLLCSLSLKHLIIDQPTYFFPSLSWDWVYSAVRAIPNLQSLTFKGPAAEMRSSLGPMLVRETHVCEVPSLKSIDVTAPSWGIKIIQDTISPSLKKVRIDASGQRELFMPAGIWNKESESIAKAFPHLSRTSPLITHLELCGVDLPSTGEFTASSLFGGAFPMLEHLTLNNARIDDSVYAEYPSGLPNLICLEIITPPTVAGDGFLSFMENRRTGFKLVRE